MPYCGAMTNWDDTYRDAPVWVKEPAGPLVAEVETFADEQLAAAGDGARPVALDIGAGEGRNARYLAERGYRVIAVEQSSVAIERGKQAAAGQAWGERITWIASRVENYAPPRRVELIALSYLQLPSEELGAILQRAMGWLAPGGRLVLIGHDISNLAGGVGGPKNPDVLHRLEELLPYVAEGTIVRAEVIERYESESAAGDADGEQAALDTVLHVIRPDQP